MRAGPRPGLLLTDGWYCIRASLDAPLAALAQLGCLPPGKL